MKDNLQSDALDRVLEHVSGSRRGFLRKMLATSAALAAFISAIMPPSAAPSPPARAPIAVLS